MEPMEELTHGGMIGMKCTAKNNRGLPCGKDAIAGHHVCYKHGGAAPQVKRTARERLASMVDPALSVIDKAMRMREKGKPVPMAFAAARDILDRTGYKATDKIQLTGAGPSGEVVFATPGDLLKAELNALHDRISLKE